MSGIWTRGQLSSVPGGRIHPRILIIARSQAAPHGNRRRGPYVKRAGRPAPISPPRGGHMQLTGIHHLTAITANASGNHAYYTGTLGMRLVKKTVNQDDVSAYHLFYADGLASPGTDL